MTLFGLLLAALPLQHDPGAIGAPQDWRYVVPERGDPFEHPPWRAVSLSATRPADLVDKVVYRAHPRYAQLRYGSPDSVRVAVVVDDAGPGQVDLFIDADRDRRIEDEDRVAGAGTGRVWSAPLAAAINEGESTSRVPRRIMLRLGSTGRILSVAAAGYMEGRVRIAGRDHVARRTDGDADGFHSGPQDSLWIDLNDDGRWDPSAEQFLYAAILNVGRDRYAVRSDPRGTSLTLAPLEGAGKVRLAIGRRETRAQVVELRAQLIGRDGSALNVEGGQTVAAPVGEYRVSDFSIVLRDPAGGPAWHFGFSERLGEQRRFWHRIEKDGMIEIDPLRGLKLEVRIVEPPEERGPGQPLTVRPWLTTGDGLLINYGRRGSPTDPSASHETTARVALRSGEGAVLDAMESGFT